MRYAPRWDTASATQIGPLGPAKRRDSRHFDGTGSSGESERKEQLLQRLRTAGVSAADGDGAGIGDWRVQGTLSEMSHFSPKVVAAGGENWDANVLASLSDMEGMYGRLAREASEVELGDDDVLEAVDLLIEMLASEG